MDPFSRKRVWEDIANSDAAGNHSEEKKAKPDYTGILLGYGNPLLDISVQSDKAFLDKYGLEANSALLADEKHLPIYKEMVEKYKDIVEYVPGGAALNTVRVAQWLLKVPNATSYFGCVADDEFGAILTKAAQSAGVNVIFQKTSKAPTGTCAVVCTDKNRSLVANLAAANCFTEDHLDVPENWATVEKAQFFYFGGYPLTVCPSAMVRIAKHACENNKIVVMNMSAPFLCSIFKEPMLKMLPYVDYWMGNETEADEFAKANNLGVTDRIEIAKKMASWEKVNKKRSRTVIITQGADPAIVVCDGQVKEYKSIPVKEDDIVDTNGAGDAFAGGFLAQLVQGQSLDECMRCGHYVANVIVQRTGCTLPDQPYFKANNS